MENWKSVNVEKDKGLLLDVSVWRDSLGFINWSGSVRMKGCVGHYWSIPQSVFRVGLRQQKSGVVPYWSVPQSLFMRDYIRKKMVSHLIGPFQNLIVRAARLAVTSYMVRVLHDLSLANTLRSTVHWRITESATTKSR